MVAARLKTDLGGSNEPGTAFADGRLTKLQTFQKFYEQHELRKWIDDALNVVSVAAAPGIFYVFRTAAAREAFLAGRTRRVLSVPKLSTREVIFNQHRELFEALGKFLTERGRMPGPDELSEHDPLIAAAGGINRAFRILEAASDIGAWAVVKELRKQDLLIYLALARFDRRPNFSDLSTSMQRDVRAFCGSYSTACKLADELLFSLGAPANIDASVRASTVGKLMPIALYIHVSALAELPVTLRIFEGCARMYYGSIPGANVLKFNRTEPKIIYLIYPDFESQPHPALQQSISIQLQTFRIKQRIFDQGNNVPILHRKELFLGTTHPLREKFARLTRAEEKWGLYENPALIGLKEGWEQTLRARGLELRGHRLIRATGVSHPN